MRPGVAASGFAKEAAVGGAPGGGGGTPDHENECRIQVNATHSTRIPGGAGAATGNDAVM